MSNLFLTLVIAFVILVFTIALLAVGWLIIGKSKIKKAQATKSAPPPSAIGLNDNPENFSSDLPANNGEEKTPPSS